MGRRGFPPQPTAIKILKGNPGRRPLNKAEPQPESGMPACPAWLDTEARREWKRVAPLLHRMGVLTKIDRSALAMYCDAWSQFLAARTVIREEGLSYVNEKTGYVQQRPEVAVYHNLQRILRGWCYELGLTPSARGRMTVSPKQEEADPFEAFLAGRQN